MGINTTNPTEKLDVNGTTRTTNLIITNGAAVGKVWQCTNANGTGAWVSPLASERYIGEWAANSGAAPSGSPTTGDYWVVNTAGTYSGTTYAAGDEIYWNGTAWLKRSNFLTLPIASASVLGGIKIGARLSIAGDGTLSSDFADWDDITGKPTTIGGYGITDFNSTFDTRFNTKISGGVNAIPKFTAANTLGNSRISDDGTIIKIGDGSAPYSATQTTIANNTNVAPTLYGAGQFGLYNSAYAMAFGVKTAVGSPSNCYIQGSYALVGFAINLNLQPVGGNVSIGHALPSEKLDVNGNIKYSGTLKPSDLTPAIGQVLYANGTSTNIWKSLIIEDIVGLAAVLDGKLSASLTNKYIPFYNGSGLVDSQLITSTDGSGTYISDSLSARIIGDNLTITQGKINAPLGVKSQVFGGTAIQMDCESGTGARVVFTAVESKLLPTVDNLYTLNIGTSGNRWKHVKIYGDIDLFTANQSITSDDRAGFTYKDSLGVVGYIGKAHALSGGLVLHNARSSDVVHLRDSGNFWLNNKRILTTDDLGGIGGGGTAGIDTVLGIGNIATNKTIEFKQDAVRDILQFKKINNSLVGSLSYIPATVGGVPYSGAEYEGMQLHNYNGGQTYFKLTSDSLALIGNVNTDTAIESRFYKNGSDYTTGINLLEDGGQRASFYFTGSAGVSQQTHLYSANDLYITAPNKNIHMGAISAGSGGNNYLSINGTKINLYLSDKGSIANQTDFKLRWNAAEQAFYLHPL